MKKFRIFGLATAAIVAFSALFATLPEKSPLTASAAETKTLSLNTAREAANVKAKLTWKFDKPVSYFASSMLSDYTNATASLVINNKGYTYSNVKVNGVDFKNNTTAGISYANQGGVSVDKTNALIRLPINNSFTITAEVIANSSDLTSKDAWLSRVDNDELNAHLAITNHGKNFIPGDQTVTPTVETIGNSDTLTFDRDSKNNYFNGTRDYIVGSTSFTDVQKKDILNATNIDITLTLSKAPSSTTGVTLYLSNSGIRTNADAEKAILGAANKDVRTIKFTNVRLNPTGSTSTFFNHYAVAAEAKSGGGNSSLNNINVTGITATLTLPDVVATTPAPIGTEFTTPAVAPTPLPAFVPGVTQNVRAAHYTNAIDVRWDMVTSARYAVYYVYFDSKGAPSAWTVKAVDTNTYSIPSPVRGATYYITVLPFTDTPTRQYGGFSPYTIVKT